jgi:hypothetical protein
MLFTCTISHLNLLLFPNTDSRLDHKPLRGQVVWLIIWFCVYVFTSLLSSPDVLSLVAFL